MSTNKSQQSNSFGIDFNKAATPVVLEANHPQNNAPSPPPPPIPPRPPVAHVNPSQPGGNKQTGMAVYSPSATTPLQTQLQQAQTPGVINLSGTPTKEAKATITSAVAQSVKQAADSNQEEYATVARTAMRERMDDFAFFSMPGINQDVLGQSQSLMNSAIAYSQKKGALASLDAQGNALVSQLNGLSSVTGQRYNQVQLQRHGEHMCLETALHNDGYLHMTYDNPKSGGYHERAVNVKLDTDLGGGRKAADLMDDIGSYASAYGKQRDNIRVLQAGHASDANTMAWNELVSGNYQALDSQWKLSEKYNNYIRSTQSDGRVSRAVDETLINPNASIRSFHGTKEEVDKIRNAVDKNGNHIFTDAELNALEECVNASGYAVDDRYMNALNNGSYRAKARYATAGLEEYQKTGVNTVRQAKRTIDTMENLSLMTSGLKEELRANKAEEKVNKLTAKLQDKNAKLTTRRQKKANKKLDKLKNRYGVSTNDELLQKVKDGRARAQEKRDKKRDLARATRGMDKTQARLALNKLRQQEYMSKHGVYSKKLAKKDRKLQRLLERQRRRSALGKKIFKPITKVKERVLNSVAGKIYTQLAAKLAASIAKLKSLLLVHVLIPAGFGILILVLICAVVAIILSLFLLFAEDNGNTDGSGKQKNDLQLVNEALSDYESARLADLAAAIETCVKTNRKTHPEEYIEELEKKYPDHTYDNIQLSSRIAIRSGQVCYKGRWRNIIGYYIKNEHTGDLIPCEKSVATPRQRYWVEVIGDDGNSAYIEYAKSGVDSTSDLSAEVNADYKVKDEFGNPASICNCMQLISIYRYFYLYADGDDEWDNQNNFWVNDFKNGRMTDGWNATHSIVKAGTQTPVHSERWEDGVEYTDITQYGDLSNGSFYHTGISGCNHSAYFTYDDTYIDDTGEEVTVERTQAICLGHVRAEVDVQVDTKLETIVDNGQLKTANASIQRDVLETNGFFDYTQDMLGTYDDNYQQGYELYAEFEVYFGATGEVLSPAEISNYLQLCEEANGEPLSEHQRAVIETALKGCGKFTYSAAQHGNCGKGVVGGANDCSGFVSWVHNNCGMYANESLCYTTQAFANAPGAIYGSSINLHTLKPGSIVVRGDKNTGSAYGAGGASTGTGNHVVIWLGYLKEPDGSYKPYVIDNASSKNGSGVRSRDITTYKSAVPIGSSDVW